MRWSATIGSQIGYHIPNLKDNQARRRCRIANLSFPMILSGVKERYFNLIDPWIIVNKKNKHRPLMILSGLPQKRNTSLINGAGLV